MAKHKLNTSEKNPVVARRSLKNKKVEINSPKKVNSSQNVKDNTKQEKANIWNPEILDDIATSLVKLSREYNDLLNSTIYNNVSIANIRTELTEDILNHFVTSISTRMQQSVGFAKELIRCKNIADVQLLQNKMLEMYFPHVINSHLSLVRNLQKFEYNRKPGSKK